MNPTICRTCGGRIERPAHDRHICEYCETDMKAPFKTDDSDLTHLIVICRRCGENIDRPSPGRQICGACLSSEVQLYQSRTDLPLHIVRLPRSHRDPPWIGILLVAAMMTLAAGSAAVFVYWLGKQAGLWGGL